MMTRGRRLVALALCSGMEENRVWHSTPDKIPLPLRRKKGRLHTIKILLLGLILLAAFVLIGRALGDGSKAALAFLPVWFVCAAINLWFGVAKAGYSLRDETPIFLLIFAVPSALALLVWWKLSVR
jgi:hypothetical protein